MKTPEIAKELSDMPHVPITELLPLQGDLKELSERNYNKLKKSLIENGVIVPFFVWLEAGKLLDGHQRQRVFLKEGWLMDVPVVYVSAATEQEAKQKLLAISSQFGQITQEGLDAFTWDISDEWIQESVHFDALPFVFDQPPEPPEPADAEPQIDRADELREKWGVELGQMWRLPSRVEGQEHRLICGDCTDEAVVERVMGGEVARYGIHDVPYGIDVVGISASAIGGANIVVKVNNYSPIVGDNEKYNPSYILSIAKDNILWGANYYADLLPVCKGWIVWDKKGREWDDNFSDCELAWSSLPIVTKIFRHVWMGMVQEGEREERVHPTQKPSELYRKIIEYCFKDDGVIIDFYAGSSPTIIAAENLSRQCRAVEISPAYVAVSLQRYVDAFGIQPELLS